MAENIDTTSDPNLYPLTAERALIGAVILAADQLRRELLSTYRTSDMHDEPCRFADRAVRDMMTEGVPVTTATLTEYGTNRLQGGEQRRRFGSWVAVLMAEGPVPVAGAWCSERVQNAATRRDLLAAAGELAEQVPDARDEDLPALRSRFADRIGGGR